jgi:heme/copper-type cytochrome/quinol oxidase subunit 3
VSDAHTALQEQFEEMPQQKEAATLGMWAFLATEVLFFGPMFMSYVAYRYAYPQAFAAASHHTILLYGTINTAILLTSSLTMVLAVNAAPENNRKWMFPVSRIHGFPRPAISRRKRARISSGPSRAPLARAEF